VKYHESLRGIEYKRVGSAYNILQYGKKIKRLDLKNENDVFDYPRVQFGRHERPWFFGSGSGRLCREYAAKIGHTFIVAKEFGSRRSRNFASYKDVNDFLSEYKLLKSSDRHLHEVIVPDKPAMLAFDHDVDGGLDQLHGHNKGVRELREILFDLLGIPEQNPVVFTSHRTKSDGKDYLSTHQRFPSVTVESWNETMKAIMHLLKHTGRDYGGIDFGVCASYQQLRIPGSSKVGSKTPLLPADGSELNMKVVASTLVSNRKPAAIHITTAMVLTALDKHFGCSEGCCSVADPTPDIDEKEADKLTDQIRDLYRKTTDQDASGISYVKGTLWNVPKATKCIHGETHKSNRMFIIVNNKHVKIQCASQSCRAKNEYVSLGFLTEAPSTAIQPWTQTPRNCYDAIVAIDIVQHLPANVDLYELAKILACIGDFKELLVTYAEDKDTAEIAWNTAINQLSNAKSYSKPWEAMTRLRQFLKYVPSAITTNRKRKRKLKESNRNKRFDFAFDFDRFNREHPHPLAINTSKGGSTQTVDMRYLEANELQLDAPCLMLHSEMGTAKTSNVLLKLVAKHKRVLVVTPKRLFAKSIQGVLREAGFNYDHYRDDDFWLNDKDEVIVELESLYKLYRYCWEPFDLVVIDESETIIRQMLCLSTHGVNLRNNWETLRWMLENSMQCFAADARMSCLTMDFVADVFSRKEIHYIRNTYQIPMQVRWFENSKAMENTLVKSVEDKEKFYCFTGTRAKALHIDKLAKDHYGADKTKLYCALNSGQSQGDLLRVNEVWKDMSAITTSPSITVGTSFNVRNIIDNVFLFLFTQTASPTDAIQAARRIRHPVNNVINVAIDGRSSNVSIRRKDIRDMFKERRSILLTSEFERVTKDFAHDQQTLQRILKELDVGSTNEVPGLITTAVNVTLARNLALRDYHEQLCRTFLSMGYNIEIVRRKIDKDKRVPVSTIPEKRAFDVHRGALGIVAYYETHSEELEAKERKEELDEDETAVLALYRFIKHYNEDAQEQVIDFQYWKDFRYCLTKDRRWQLLTQADESDVVDQGDRNTRFQIAGAQHRHAERTGTLQSAGVPELSSSAGGIYVFAKPLFGLFKLLEMIPKEGKLKTTSTTIKANAAEIQKTLRQCRALVGASKWTGGDLPKTPTYKQLAGFLVRVLDNLVGGGLKRTEQTETRGKQTVRVVDKRKPGGSTTRKKKIKVSKYKMEFKTTGKAKLSTLDRVKHLVSLDL